MLSRSIGTTTKLFVEYGPGVGTFTRPILEKLGPDAKLIAIDTNPDFIDYLNGDIDDPPVHRGPGSAADVEKIIAEHGFDHADYVLSGLPFSTLPPGVGEAIGAATGRASSALAAPSSSISSAPRCATSSPRISSASTAASNGSTCRPRPCSGPGGRAERLELARRRNSAGG